VARRFASATQWINCALGAQNFDFGPGTIAVICKVDSFAAERDIFSVGVGGTARLYLRTLSSPAGLLNLQLTASSSNAVTALTAGKWYLIAATKATGTVAPRFHMYDYAAGTWMHENGPTAIANSGVFGGSTVIGAQIDHSVPMDGDIAAIGLWNVAFGDQQCESLAYGLNAWWQEQPRALWVLDQADPPVEYTKVLMHMEGANTTTNFLDSADPNRVSTVSGNAQIDTTQFKFGGSSAHFDGSGDYISYPDSTDWYFGSGDFTIDFWVRFNTLTNIGPFFVQRFDANSFWYFDKETNASGNKLYIRFATASAIKGEYMMTNNWSVNTGQWYHIAAVRNGSTVMLFIDGVSQALSSATPIGSNDVGDVAATLTIGGSSIYGWYLDGWLDEVRIVKGQAVWTANFTPPAASYSTPDNTVRLLLHADGADGSTTFTDSAAGRAITAVGNAQIDTAQSQFGGASALFDGSGDILTAPDSADWDFGGGDFTLECWVRFNAIQQCWFFSQNAAADGDRSWDMLLVPPSTFYVFRYATAGSGGGAYANQFTTTWTPVVNTWYHLAVTRNGANVRGFVNGTQVGSTFSMGADTIRNSAAVLAIGNTSGGGGGLNGWLDEVRIVKGRAMWTANFTPPTAPYADPPAAAATETIIDQSGGGANETSRQGTTQSTVSVPVFNYGT
jgi:hypothetical protein